MHLRDVYRAVSQSVRRAREAAVTACACRRGGAGRGVWWTPSGCCSQLACARLQAACLQISGVAGPAGCPPAHTHEHIHLHTLMNGHTHARTHSCTCTLARIQTELLPHVHRRGWHTDFVLNLGFDHVDGVGGFDFQRDRLAPASADTRLEYRRTHAQTQGKNTGTRVASHVSVLTKICIRFVQLRGVRLYIEAQPGLNAV